MLLLWATTRDAISYKEGESPYKSKVEGSIMSRAKDESEKNLSIVGRGRERHRSVYTYNSIQKIMTKNIVRPFGLLTSYLVFAARTYIYSAFKIKWKNITGTHIYPSVGRRKIKQIHKIWLKQTDLISKTKYRFSRYQIIKLSNYYISIFDLWAKFRQT